MHKTDCNCLELLDTKTNVFTRLSLKFAEMISWLSTGRFWCSAGVCYRFEHEFDKRNKKSNFSLHLKHWSSTSSADEVLEHEIISFCMRKKMAKSLKLLISIIISFNVSVTTGIPGRMVMSSDVISYDSLHMTPYGRDDRMMTSELSWSIYFNWHLLI